MKYNLPAIILNGIILLPGSSIKLEFEDEASKNLIYESEVFQDNRILVSTNLSEDGSFNIKKLPSIGTVAKIENKIELPNGKIRVNLLGIVRCMVIDYLNTGDSIESLVSTIKDEVIDEYTSYAINRKLISEVENYVEKVPYVSNSLLSLINKTNNLSKITDIITNHLQLDFNKKMAYLMEKSTVKRVEMLLSDIYKEEQLFNIEKDIDTKVQEELEDSQKNYYLKEKIKHLKSELGETSLKDDDIEILKSKTENLHAPNNIKNKILYEINKYENMSNLSPEISMVRNYINLMLELPWDDVTEDITDFDLIKKNLDSNHYGLDELKNRIIEYLAVTKNSNDINAPIICLVGPPGVGKTTFAYSVAKSIGRNFVKISVGGVDDEAFIKGHIKTYLGSVPGKIIDGIKRSKSSNPVFLIDEIDKMSKDYKGDPRSALLEVLDSSQNVHFKDNYLDEEYDLSKVFFITTANDIDSIPLELKDRLEIINITGYTEIEKIEITKKYIIPSISLKNGINSIKISDDDILNIIRYYTHESGLRELERCVCKIIRKIVTDKVVNNKKVTLTIKNIEKYLGKKIYDFNNIGGEIGIANALAYTNVGGDTVSIETTHYKGSGNLIITGSLGDVMVESAKIALSYIKANYKIFNIDYKVFNDDIHINVPNISLMKEGPSAGVSIVTSIISDLSNLKIENNIAFMGEITLRGNILKVGRIKEKVIGAYINNINKIFIPYDNLQDLDDIPKEVKDKIEFLTVKNYKEVFDNLKVNLNGNK